MRVLRDRPGRFARNLTPGEIVDQVLIVQEDMGKRVTNAVGMGQGEPFLNYDNTMAALRIPNHKKGLEIGARHISVSTCGILPGLERFSEEPGAIYPRGFTPCSASTDSRPSLCLMLLATNCLR